MLFLLGRARMSVRYSRDPFQAVRRSLDVLGLFILRTQVEALLQRGRHRQRRISIRIGRWREPSLWSSPDREVSSRSWCRGSCGDVWGFESRAAFVRSKDERQGFLFVPLEASATVSLFSGGLATPWPAWHITLLRSLEDPVSWCQDAPTRRGCSKKAQPEGGSELRGPGIARSQRECGTWQSLCCRAERPGLEGKGSRTRGSLFLPWV